MGAVFNQLLHGIACLASEPSKQCHAAASPLTSAALPHRPDGNKWTRTAATAAFETKQPWTLHGLFIDSAHYIPGTLAGVRVFAEKPQHILHIIGSDDGNSWWYLTGDCHGPGSAADGTFVFQSKDYFAVDFRPKGGPNVIASTSRGAV